MKTIKVSTQPKADTKRRKVADLQPGPHMDALVAEARGWVRETSVVNVDYWKTGKPGPDTVIWYHEYNPSTNGGQCFELIKEFNLSLIKTPYGWQCDYKESVAYDDHGTITRTRCQIDETPEIAICRAVIALKFGEYIEVEEE